MRAWNSMSATTATESTQTAESACCSSAQERSGPSEPGPVTPSLFGGSSLTTALTSEPESGSEGLIARPSETKVRIEARNSYVRRMRLLIASGLIAGITPMSIRRGFNQGCLGGVFSRPDGDMSASVKTNDGDEPGPEAGC